MTTSTLTDWKARRAEYLACPCDDLRALRKPKHLMMERVLQRHIVRSNEAGLPVTSRQAQLTALSFVRQADPTSMFKASAGWLHRVKHRLGVNAYRPHKESQSCDTNGVKIAREGMPKQLADIGCTKSRDIYNMDETGMYPWAAPDRTLAFRLLSGRKKDMNCLTFMLYCSADGFHREVPLVNRRYGNTVALRKMTLHLGASGSTMVLRG